jgi:hypothetical protein
LLRCWTLWGWDGMGTWIWWGWQRSTNEFGEGNFLESNNLHDRKGDGRKALRWLVGGGGEWNWLRFVSGNWSWYQRFWTSVFCCPNANLFIGWWNLIRIGRTDYPPFFAHKQFELQKFILNCLPVLSFSYWQVHWRHVVMFGNQRLFINVRFNVYANVYDLVTKASFVKRISMLKVKICYTAWNDMCHDFCY